MTWLVRVVLGALLWVVACEAFLTQDWYWTTLLAVCGTLPLAMLAARGSRAMLDRDLFEFYWFTPDDKAQYALRARALFALALMLVGIGSLWIAAAYVLNLGERGQLFSRFEFFLVPISAFAVYGGISHLAFLKRR